MNTFETSRRDDLLVGLIRAQRKPVIGKLAEWLLWALSVEVPREVEIGDRFRFRHSSGSMVLYPFTRIGKDVSFLHGVTIGRADVHLCRDRPGTLVVIEDNVLVCAGATILVAAGETLTIGNGAVVGANALVTKNVPAREIWAGNPARKVGEVGRG